MNIQWSVKPGDHAVARSTRICCKTGDNYAGFKVEDTSQDHSLCTSVKLDRLAQGQWKCPHNEVCSITFRLFCRAKSGWRSIHLMNTGVNWTPNGFNFCNTRVHVGPCSHRHTCIVSTSPDTNKNESRETITAKYRFLEMTSHRLGINTRRNNPPHTQKKKNS